MLKIGQMNFILWKPNSFCALPTNGAQTATSGANTSVVDVRKLLNHTVMQCSSSPKNLSFTHTQPQNEKRSTILSPPHTQHHCSGSPDQVACLRPYFLTHRPAIDLCASRSPHYKTFLGKKKNPVSQEAQEWTLEFLMTQCTKIFHYIQNGFS